MTEEQFNIEMTKAQKEYETKVFEIKRKYAHSNNPYNFGDLVKDHIGWMKIERIFTASRFDSKFSECVFKGLELKADCVTPIKNQEGRSLWQSNILEFKNPNVETPGQTTA